MKSVNDLISQHNETKYMSINVSNINITLDEGW